MTHHTPPTETDWRHLINVAATAYLALVALFAIGAVLKGL